MKNSALSLISILLISLSLTAQEKSQDPVLFSVEDTPVHVSEFIYIYSKTNGDKADFSKASLEEYLDLYTKFKLKVKRAKYMKLDTIPQLIKELEGYRQQLADSYLINKEITEKLVKEAFDRRSQDVSFSHILFRTTITDNPKDTLKAYQNALETRKKIIEGMAFETAAQEFSEDNTTNKNGGFVGFLNVLFPSGFYPLENAAYTLEVGEVSEPIRTKMGYHLLKVNERRAARGELEASHILIRTEATSTEDAKIRIDSIYKALQAGADFADMAKTVSEDKRSAVNGGYLGFLGINKYEKRFEDAAFKLREDNQLSEPFLTSLGWHVVKRISARGIQPYAIEKRRLEAAIKNDDRFETAKGAMIAQIKKENQFKENTIVLNEFIRSLNDTFLTYKWQPVTTGNEEVLFTLGDQKATIGDLNNFFRNSSRQRMTLARSGDVNYVSNLLYKEFLDQYCLDFEEAHLEEKYPDFKSLMREYEEGILLFEATKVLVWDKAAQDTVGLKKYFQSIKGQYKWGERAVVSIYRVNEANKDQLDLIVAAAKTKNYGEVMDMFNKDGEILTVEEEKMEQERSMELKRMDWKPGSISRIMPDSKKKIIEFMKIEKILPPQDKTLDEARGYIIADYQDFLEKQWVEELQKQYKVKVNQKVFDQLIKK